MRFELDWLIYCPKFCRKLIFRQFLHKNANFDLFFSVFLLSGPKCPKVSVVDKVSAGKASVSKASVGRVSVRKVVGKVFQHQNVPVSGVQVSWWKSVRYQSCPGIKVSVGKVSWQQTVCYRCILWSGTFNKGKGGGGLRSKYFCAYFHAESLAFYTIKKFQVLLSY